MNARMNAYRPALVPDAKGDRVPFARLVGHASSAVSHRSLNILSAETLLNTLSNCQDISKMQDSRKALSCLVLQVLTSGFVVFNSIRV